MIQDEIKQMLQKVSKDKFKLSKLYANGYFSYSKNPNYIGYIAIINRRNKAVISYLQDVNDESKVIATVNFQNGCLLIYTLLGNNFSLKQIGKNLLNINGNCTRKIYNPNEEGIKHDIDLIRSQCLEASESNSDLISRLFDKSKLSKANIKGLIEGTLVQLDNSSIIKETNNVSPKVNVASILPRDSHSQRTSSENLHEI